MAIGWLAVGTLHFSLSAVLVFIVLSGIALCLGHSLGMHRKLIHGAFDTPKWLERCLVYLGTLVGLGGPFTMMYAHDIRDWAQRKPACHDFLSHGQSIWIDYWWQLHCKLYLSHKPDFRYPETLTGDRFYRWLQATSMLQQIPVGVILFAAGGWGWHLEGVSTQGYNLPNLGLITFGECWHNNHHAFPGSAKLGLRPSQFDPGWIVVRLLHQLGLASNIQTPDTLPARANLIPIAKLS